MIYVKCFKRAFDLIIAILVFPFILIVGLIVSAAIYIEDKGPIFYNAKRLGFNGSTFYMYKFRSMKVDAEDIRNADGSTFNAEDDPRVTRVGHFIRRTSIDELPQIFNVLKGDMSIIGPRPDLPEHINLYTDDEKLKLELRPGITGYNQAYYRNTISWKERLRNDVVYLKNISFLLDIKILIRTIFVVLLRKDIYIILGDENATDEKE